VQRIPLYIRIAEALAIGVVVELVSPPDWTQYFDIRARMILPVLVAIAPPLILVAMMQALIDAKASGRLAGKVFFLLVLNTVVAIQIELTVANAICSGSHAALPPGEAPKLTGDPLAQLLDNLPSSIVRPLLETTSSE
jgi:Na+/H+-dicarboxylate symporter